MSNFDNEMQMLQNKAAARQLRSDAYYLLKQDYLAVKDLADDDLDYIVDCGQNGRVAIKTIYLERGVADSALNERLINKAISKQRQLRVSRLAIITNDIESVCTDHHEYVIMSAEYIKTFHIQFKQYPNIGCLDQAFYPDNFKRIGQNHQALLNYSNQVDKTPLNYDKEYLYNNAPGFEKFAKYTINRDQYEREIVTIVDQFKTDSNFAKTFYTLLRDEFVYEMYVPYYEEVSKINLFQSHDKLSIMFFNAEYIYVDDQLLADLRFIMSLCDEKLSEQQFTSKILNHFGNPLKITTAMVIKKIVQIVLGLALIILLLNMISSLNI